MTDSTMQTNSPEIPNDEDEISLLELWDILVRRKIVILVIFFAVMVGAFGYVVTTKPVYQSKTIVVLGSFMGSDLENPVVLVQWVRERYRVGDSSEGGKTMPYLTDVSNASKGAGSVVTFTAAGESPEQVREYLEGVLETIGARQDTLFASSVEREVALLDTLRQRLSQINEQASNFSKRIKAVERENAALAAMLVLEKSKILDRVTELENQIVDIETRMSGLETKPMEIIREPTLPASPSKPKKKLVLALSFVLGIFMGIFAAFFAEFLANAKKMRRERVNQ